MSTKVKMYLYLIVAILAQSAVVAIIPASIMPYVAAVVAAITTILAFKDPSTGMDKAMANATAGRPLNSSK